jgi:hypothetical protein
MVSENEDKLLLRQIQIRIPLEQDGFVVQLQQHVEGMEVIALELRALIAVECEQLSTAPLQCGNEIANEYIPRLSEAH